MDAALFRFAFQPLSERPLVSVLLSSYNYGDYVGEAIASVFLQTYRPLELVVVDDGSTDRSREVIDAAIAEAPIPVEKIYRDNGGQASAWNAGYPKLQGELIALLDSDDLWQPEKVERMVGLARAHPEAGVYQHQLDNAAGELKKPELISRDLLPDWMALGEVPVTERAELVAVFLPSTGLVARREVLDRVFPIPETLRTCPDAFLTRMSCIFGPLVSTDEILGSWREHEANAGKTDTYSFQQYWLPVVMPAINAGFQERGVPVRFVGPSPPPTRSLFRRIARRLARIVGLYKKVQ